MLAGFEIIRLGNKHLKVSPQYTRKIRREMNVYNRLAIDLSLNHREQKKNIKRKGRRGSSIRV